MPSGSDVDHWRVGDEVLGFTFLGCYAEQVVVDAGQVVGKPPTQRERPDPEVPVLVVRHPWRTTSTGTWRVRAASQVRR
jgi:hypothetical protein